MTTWTYNAWSNGLYICAVVSADNIEVAKIKLKEQIEYEYPGSGHTVFNVNLIPLPVSTRKARIIGSASVPIG